MKILGARVLVEDGDNLDYSDLLKVASNGHTYYFIRDLGTGDFNPLCVEDVENADRRLEKSGAELYRKRDSTLEKQFIVFKDNYVLIFIS